MELRDLTANDVDVMVELWTDPDVERLMDDFGPRTATEVMDWLPVELETSRCDPTHGGWVISDDNGEAAGLIMFGQSDRPVGDISFAYLVLPQFRGRGLASDALRTVVVYCFDELGVASVWGETAIDNRASERVMLNAGLTFIGEVNGQRQFRIRR